MGRPVSEAALQAIHRGLARARVCSPAARAFLAHGRKLLNLRRGNVFSGLNRVADEKASWSRGVRENPPSPSNGIARFLTRAFALTYQPRQTYAPSTRGIFNTAIGAADISAFDDRARKHSEIYAPRP